VVVAILAIIIEEEEEVSSSSSINNNNKNAPCFVNPNPARDPPVTRAQMSEED